MKTLVDWGGEQTLRAAENLISKGLVASADWSPPTLSGRILRDTRPLETTGKLSRDGTLESDCPCYLNRERGMICEHIIAVALTLVKRATDPEREAKYQEEMRRASRLAQIDDSQFIRRAPASDINAIPAELTLELDENWQAQWTRGSVTLCCALTYRGETHPLDAVPRTTDFHLSKEDEALLFVLEDICTGPALSRIELKRSDFLNALRLRSGSTLNTIRETSLSVSSVPLTGHLRMELDGENGEILLFVHTEMPFMPAGTFPSYFVDGKQGWAFGANTFCPLNNVLPLPYHGIYTDPVVVQRTDVIRFLHQELPLLQEHTTIESDLSPDLFTITPATPRFKLLVKGSPASLSATLLACYGEFALTAGKSDPNDNFALPDPDDLLSYRVRNPEAERHALTFLEKTGFCGDRGDTLNSLIGDRNVLNFFGSGLPLLRRHGWTVDVQGRVTPYMEELDFATPVVNIQEPSEGQGWFDVSFDFEQIEGASISHADIQRALRKGENFLRRGGKTILIDSDAVDSMLDVFSDCGGQAGEQSGHFQLSHLYAPFIKSSLEGLDGIDVEMTASWRDQAARQNRTLRMAPAPIMPPLTDILRKYQTEGVDWLYFLEENQFCGLLADEMGLGKTLQTLAWLQLPRCNRELTGLPSLIVCPTSLVDNWASEAEKFVPHLNVLTLSGADRHQLWNEVEKSDLVITSYALLRRDLEHYEAFTFAAAVLDEAQHIKNRSTQNAKASRKISAHHRLVLTGTPVENSVNDLWSIMDFLMPSYLGAHESFRQNYERPISRGGEEAEAAQRKLRRKLQPFLLRRLKTHVARDLPPKIERIARCPLSADQKAVYTELRDASRRKLANMVASKGFNKSRMEVLTTLLRLRQASCHLGLLKMPDLKAKKPSAKLDTFFELIDEALDGEHRVLVFSQFTSMLGILRDELETRGLTYCYLDGSTKKRGEVVKTFNQDRTIPIFLISLKAGGTGLNLTGADMVIHFDPWWNPAVEAQATDRAHRIGQKRSVYSIKLIAEGTVEEKVLELQKKKRAVIDATVESDEQMMRSLSWEDVQSILE